uniref:SIR2-like domain-containing protein n=1 Tax=Candidatus Kentrum sp. FM TaxID=2126340 RepID=A0A450S201_9GAMM|nr:MAG: SIR2-like domain-containing protein [Candidatus Kentron sp. FM]VFJ46653.1 MAG: SIR2-like domain-containing protein [Candidatus Kentron sp. FM]VFK06846.1 MAG: SIR2-like domain-containing protein [Candidatus Kentron sp. FM]
MIDLIPEELLDDISNGECLPVIGAGFSRNAILPSGCRMPLWDDLGKEVATRRKRPFSGNTIATLSEYSEESSRFELVKLLRRSLHIATARPGTAHDTFAKLPFKQILTTNFDFLIERAYMNQGKPYLPIVDEDLLSFGQPDGETRIIKMHGDLHHPNLMVVTEEDYDKFRDARELMFYEVANLLIHNSVLFVGYSIDDPDFRQILRLVEKHVGKFQRPTYAMLVGATNAEVETYKRRGVTRVITLHATPKEYGATLANAFSTISTFLNAPSKP